MKSISLLSHIYAGETEPEVKEGEGEGSDEEEGEDGKDKENTCEKDEQGNTVKPETEKDPKKSDSKNGKDDETSEEEEEEEPVSYTNSIEFLEIMNTRISTETFKKCIRHYRNLTSVRIATAAK